ncbi:9994_t:CDS:2 [Racocetra fulgida]|uniref:9994_t:CDS:1 n=1 Tax=Racocetra fulgida TaxID=60492 RepID=A0A9N9CCH8_9GLOM|nr:9994_t:CDS:2 [Racocetra fulgida]
MLLQLQERKPPTSRKTSRSVCYRCGRPGHISQNCQITNPQPNFLPNLVPQNQPNLPPVQAPANPPFLLPPPMSVNPGVNNAPENWQQETLQALLALAASLNHARRPSGNLRPTKRRKEGLEEEGLEEETLEQLMEEEADKEEKVDNFPDLAIDPLETVVDPPVVPAKVVAAKSKHENETPNCLPLPSFPDTLILNFPIDVHYTLLNSPLLPLTPNYRDINTSLLNTPASYTSRPVSPQINAYDPLPSTSSAHLPINAYSLMTRVEDRRRREILISPSNLNNLLPLTYYDPDSYSSSDDDSDTDDVIDEDNQKTGIRKKINNKPSKVAYCYDKAENAYLREEIVKPDPCGYKIRKAQDCQKAYYGKKNRDIIETGYRAITLGSNFELYCIISATTVIKSLLSVLSKAEQNKRNFITMNPVETPSNIQKTLALLKSQIEKAGLEEMYMVSPRSQTESDRQRLRRKMLEFLQDIRRSGISSTLIKAPPGDTWEEKVSSLCRRISSDQINRRSQLPYYYGLGALMEEAAWGKKAKTFVKQLTAGKSKELLTTTHRTHQLYKSQGPSYLFIMQHLTPFIICLLLKEDFLKLNVEAQKASQDELNAIIGNFAGVQ